MGPGKIETCVMDTFVVHDRSGKHERVIAIDNHGNVAIRMAHVLWLRFEGTPDDITSIDPDGGPYISVGSRFGDWILTHIDRVDDDDPQSENERTVSVYGRAYRSPRLAL